MNESLARTLHDHGMHQALARFFNTHVPIRCVGIMGGHSLLRTDTMFEAIAHISKRLTEDGFYMLSGGGPGAMESICYRRLHVSAMKDGWKPPFV